MTHLEDNEDVQSMTKQQSAYESFTIPLNEYLYQRKQNPTQHIVIGNEACDADSIISSICFGYIHDCYCSFIAASESNNATPITMRELTTPILSMSQRDIITQRPETILLLQLAGISKHDILNHLWYTNQYTDYLNKYLLRKVSSKQQQQDHSMTTIINLTLVDHNRFDADQRFVVTASNATTNALASADLSNVQYNVIGILDHHMDEQHHLESTTSNTPTNNNEAGNQPLQPIQYPFRNITYDNTNNVALVASTCTLLVEILQESYLSNPKGTLLPASLSLLLLGVIVLDSVNMNERIGKGTIRDANAIQFLLQYTNWDTLGYETKKLLIYDDTDRKNNSCSMEQPSSSSSSSPVLIPNTTRLFQILQNAKFSKEFWNSLSIIDALKLDYKQYQYNSDNNNVETTTTKFGISTILMPMKDFFIKEDYDVMMYHIYEYMVCRNIALLGIMFASTNSIANEDTSTGNNNLNRELAIIGINSTTNSSNVVDQLTKYLFHTDDTLDLVDVSDSIANNNHANELLNIRFFQQDNSMASRKQVAPIVLNFFSTVQKSSE